VSKEGELRDWLREVRRRAGFIRSQASRLEEDIVHVERVLADYLSAPREEAEDGQAR
jgi:hypothetical protein